MRQLLIAILCVVACGGLWMCILHDPASPTTMPDGSVNSNVNRNKPEAKIGAGVGSFTRFGVAQPEQPGSLLEGNQPLFVFDAAGRPASGLPVLGPLSGESQEFAIAWNVLFKSALVTDESGAWRPKGRSGAVSGTYAVLVAPHICVLAPVDNLFQLVLPEIHELNIIPSGFGDGEQWSFFAQPDFGEHGFDEYIVAGGVRVLLREVLLKGSSQMQSFPVGPMNSEWSLVDSTPIVPTSLSQNRVALPAAVQITRLRQEDRVTLSVLAADRTRLLVDGVVRVAKEPNQMRSTAGFRDGVHVFSRNTFRHGERYLIDLVLDTGAVAGPIQYDPARDGLQIVAVVPPDAPRVLSIAIETRAATNSVLIEHGGGFTQIPKLTHSSVGGAWFAQRAPGMLAVFLAESQSDGRVIWIVDESGAVSIASLDSNATTIKAVAESVAETAIEPATFGVDEWPPKGLVALEVELLGAVSGKREIVPVAAVLTSEAGFGFGPFLRLTGPRAQSFGLMSPGGGKRIRVRLVE